MKRTITALICCFTSFSLFAQQPKLILPIGHTDQVMSAQFSPDGKKVVTASGDHTAKIWDAATGDLLADLKGHFLALNNAGFSPDGKKVVTASVDQTAKIWDATTGALLINLKGHTGWVNNAGFSPDGKMVVTASWDKTAKIWNATTGALLKDLKGHTRWLNNAEFSPDNKKVVTASLDSTAKIWDVATGALLADLKGHTREVLSARFSADGKKVVTASKDKTVKIWDAATGVLLENLKSTADFSNATFSPDGKKVVTSSDDQIAEIWDVATGAPLITLADLKWHADVVNDVEFSADGKKVVTSTFRNTVKIWDVATGTLLADLKGHTNDVLSARFSPDGKKVVTASRDNTAKIWDVATGTLLADLKGHAYSMASALFGPDGKKVLTASADNTAKIWDATTGVLIEDLKGHRKGVFTARFSPDGKKVVTASADNTAKIWDAATGVMIEDLKGHTQGVLTAKFSPDSKKVVTTSLDNTAKIWDTTTGALLANLGGHTQWVLSAEFSSDGKKVLTMSLDTTAKVWDAITGKLLSNLKGFTTTLEGAEFSPDGKKVVTACQDKTARIWNAVSGTPITDLKGHTGSVFGAGFSPDGKKVVTYSADNTVKVWDASSGTLLANLKGPNSRYLVMSAQFIEDGKKVLTASGEAVRIWDANTRVCEKYVEFSVNTAPGDVYLKTGLVLAKNISELKFSDLNTGRSLYSFYAIDSTDYFDQIPTGYYMCTQNAAKLLHYVTKNLEVITFDQLDIRYNRPDKVLEAIGCPDTALIHAYHRAYEKRIRKLGIDTTSFKSGYSVPKSDFKNRDQIEREPERNQDQLTLRISGSDSTYNLDRFNVWVNQVPVYGIRGISLKRKIRHNLDTTVTITLSQGRNRIETSITDINGTESYHMPLFVKYTPDKSVDTLIHFVGIGINKFKDKNYNLSWSVKDIHDLALKFKDKYKDKCTIDTLFDENVTSANVIALKKDLLKCGVNDKVIIAYSGHGLLSKDYDYFLSTYNVDFKDPAKNGLPYDALENLLDSIPARKKLMLIDACHSGELDKDEMNRYTQTTADRQKKGVTDPGHPKGTHIDLVQKNGLSMASSFELMKQLFVNVGKSTGATVISAAGGVQYALEKNDLKNGVFTYSILENMQQNPHVNLSSLKQYVNKRVTELTAGMQVPTTRNETDVVDWQVW